MSFSIAAFRALNVPSLCILLSAMTLLFENQFLVKARRKSETIFHPPEQNFNREQRKTRLMFQPKKVNMSDCCDRKTIGIIIKFNFIKSFVSVSIEKLQEEVVSAMLKLIKFLIFAAVVRRVDLQNVPAACMCVPTGTCALNPGPGGGGVTPGPGGGDGTGQIVSDK